MVVSIYKIALKHCKSGLSLSDYGLILQCRRFRISKKHIGELHVSEMSGFSVSVCVSVLV